MSPDNPNSGTTNIGAIKLTKVVVVKPNKNLTVTGWLIRSAPKGSSQDEYLWTTVLRFGSDERDRAIAEANSLASAKCNKGLYLAVIPVGY